MRTSPPSAVRALVPGLHREIHTPVERAHSGGSLTVVNTVYDFLNQSRDPHGPWPLGETDVTLRHTDLLIVDAEEARRISGADTPEEAAHRFVEAGVSAVVVTCGAADLFAVAVGGRFAPLEGRRFPISARISRELAEGAGRNGDTTGCGDNFVGGVLYALAHQLHSGERRLDLYHAVTWGVVSGGYACFSLGGTTIESKRGEKLQALSEYVREYRRQLGAVNGDA